MVTAWAALILWPMVAIMFYQKMNLPVALCATILGGYLLLPTQVGLDLPVLPTLNKHSIPALSALILTAISIRSRQQTWPSLQGWLPRNPLVLVLMGSMILGAFGTVLTNRDPLPTAPGLRLYDGFSMALGATMALIPFLLARRVLSTVDGQRTLLKVLVIAASAYAVLALYEVRMSPQLNNMIYGFFPHSFVQHFRSGAWRPIVFLSHGLLLGIFLSAAIIAAFGMFRMTEGRPRLIWGCAGLWLLGTLVLSKTLGALAITLLALGALFFLPQRIRLIAVACIAGLVLLYPVPRAVGILPLDLIVSFAESIDPARAASFQYRLNNEDILLARAQERPVFGWGGYGRNRVFDEWEYDISTTDGSWIILLGLGGWARYIGELGLLSLGAIVLFFQRRETLDPVNATLALMLAANLLDLIPNSGVSPLTWMMAGALVGRLERGAVGKKLVAEPEQSRPMSQRPPKPTYTRSVSTLDSPDPAGPVYTRTRPVAGRLPAQNRGLKERDYTASNRPRKPRTN